MVTEPPRSIFCDTITVIFQFHTDNNPPIDDVNFNTEVFYKVVKRSESRVVVVMDTSTSMVSIYCFS